MNLSTTTSVIITAIPALLIIMSGFAKLAGTKQVVETMTKIGALQYMKVFALAEILFAALFVIPATNGLGFVLCVCYFSGALATDLTHGRKVVAPVVFLVMLFVVEWLVNSSIFLL
jgi:hypothetical protein